ncbi:MAG: TonB-dependent receptor plug domain-containing protein [Porticoccaceae bacterium]
MAKLWFFEKCAFGLSLLVLFLFSTAPAADNTYLTEGDFHEEIPMVYGITHFVQPIEDAPAAVSVISREAIRAIDAQSINDILALVPGFSLQLTAQNQLARGYQMSSDPFARRMHVEIDGRPLSESMLVTALWDDIGIDLDDIDRVEVVRGSNLPADGGNAMLGAINIITASPLLASRARLKVRSDEDGYRRFNFNAATRVAGADAQLWVQQRRKSSIQLSSTESPERGDGYALVGDDDAGGASEVQSTSEYDRVLGARLLWSPTALDSIELSAGFSESRRHAGGQQARYSWQQLEWQRQLADGGHWQGFVFHNNNRITAEGELAVGEVSYLLDPPLTYPGTTPSLSPSLSSERVREGELFQTDESASSERWDAELRRLWRSDTGWQWSLGGAATLDRAQSFYITHDNQTHQRSSGRLYSTGEWRLNSDWLLSGGVMVEWTEHLSSVGAARLGLNYSLQQHTLRLAAALGGRQPTLLEQHRQSYFEDDQTDYLDLIVISAPNIDVENVELIELGYHWRSTDRSIDVDMRWYRQWVKDAIVATELVGELVTAIGIDYLVSSEQFIYFDNRSDIVQHGIEIDFTARPNSHWLVHAAVSYTDSDEQLSDLNLDTPFSLSVVESAGSLSASQVTARWSLGAMASYSPNQNWHFSSHYTWQESVPVWLKSPGKSAGQWDIVARYNQSSHRLLKDWELTAAVRNIGDRQLFGQEHFLGRRVVLTLEFKWP